MSGTASAPTDTGWCGPSRSRRPARHSPGTGTSDPGSGRNRPTPRDGRIARFGRRVAGMDRPAEWSRWRPDFGRQQRRGQHPAAHQSPPDSCAPGPVGAGGASASAMVMLPQRVAVAPAAVPAPSNCDRGVIGQAVGFGDDMHHQRCRPGARVCGGAVGAAAPARRAGRRPRPSAPIASARRCSSGARIADAHRGGHRVQPADPARRRRGRTTPPSTPAVPAAVRWRRRRGGGPGRWSPPAAARRGRGGPPSSSMASSVLATDSGPHPTASRGQLGIDLGAARRGR